MTAIIEAVLPVLLNLLQTMPEIVADIESAWNFLTSQNPPTADQQTAIDAALDAAHAKLQGTPGTSGTAA